MSEGPREKYLWKDAYNVIGIWNFKEVENQYTTVKCTI